MVWYFHQWMKIKIEFEVKVWLFDYWLNSVYKIKLLTSLETTTPLHLADGDGIWNPWGREGWECLHLTVYCINLLSCSCGVECIVGVRTEYFLSCHNIATTNNDSVSEWNEYFVCSLEMIIYLFIQHHTRTCSVPTLAHSVA